MPPLPRPSAHLNPPRGNIGVELVVFLGVERPGRAGCQCVIIKSAEFAKILKSRIIIIAEGEMPPPTEVAVLNLAVDLVDVIGITNLNYGLPPFRKARTLSSFYIIHQLGLGLAA